MEDVTISLKNDEEELKMAVRIRTQKCPCGYVYRKETFTDKVEVKEGTHEFGSITILAKSYTDPSRTVETSLMVCPECGALLFPAFAMNEEIIE